VGPGYADSMRRLLVLVVACVGLAGCASVFPKEMLRGVDRSLTLAVLRSDPERYRQARVVLAGEIIETRPRTGSTEIEVLSRPLGEGDAPQRTDHSDGRFLVLAPDFLDPAVYAPGRRVSVVGTVAGSEERTLGDQPYRYVMIRADQIYLWPRPVAGAAYPYPPAPFPYYDRFGWPYYW
jgi:outer membrane lipoprotein